MSGNISRWNGIDGMERLSRRLTLECAIAFAALLVRGGSWGVVQPLFFLTR